VPPVRQWEILREHHESRVQYAESRIRSTRQKLDQELAELQTAKECQQSFLASPKPSDEKTPGFRGSPVS